MKVTLTVLAFLSLAGLAMSLPGILPARSSSDIGAQPASAATCVDRYNSLLTHAQTTLAAGDRAASVDLLEQAQQILPACPALQDAASPQGEVLTLNNIEAPWA